MVITVATNQLLSLSYRAIFGVLASFIAFRSAFSKLTSWEELLEGEVVIVGVVWLFVLSGSIAYLAEGGKTYSYFNSCCCMNENRESTQSDQI